MYIVGSYKLHALSIYLSLSMPIHRKTQFSMFIARQVRDILPWMVTKSYTSW